MKVLSYVSGILTVINGESFYKKESEKPSFILGNNFYYEPTLKMMDGSALSAELMEQAEEYISSFDFTVPVVEEPLKHYVDADGNYIGNDGTIEVANASTSDTQKWINRGWVEACLIDSDTKKYIGSGDTRTASNTEYAPNTLGITPFSPNRYSWDGMDWSISLEDAKECKTLTLEKYQRTELNAMLGAVASWEVASFKKQEEEARNWIVDNNYPTPFVDTLLISRNLGETKTELVELIIEKADIFLVAYPSMLGKFHRLTKQVKAATTVEEVEVVVW
jgi:hypothetical protein